MSIVVIPDGITEEELRSCVKAPPEKPQRKRGWAAYWEKNEPKVPYTPPPPITPEELRQYRESKGWYQKHLAIRTGYSVNTIKHIELGVVNVSSMLSSMVHLMKENDRLTEENERLKASQKPV
jgi:DNA-binding transcriptional regulator YiaG